MIVEELKSILDGITPGTIFTADGNGGVQKLGTRSGPDKVEVTLYPAEHLGLQEIREALEDMHVPGWSPWRLLDDGMPGVYSPGPGVAELVDTLSTRAGAFVIALLNTRQACHKCSSDDCHLNGEPESAGIVLLEPTPL